MELDMAEEFDGNLADDIQNWESDVISQHEEDRPRHVAASQIMRLIDAGFFWYFEVVEWAEAQAFPPDHISCSVFERAEHLLNVCIQYVGLAITAVDGDLSDELFSDVGFKLTLVADDLKQLVNGELEGPSNRTLDG
jgi:hypothetical protein